MRIRIEFSKTGPMIYIGNLDMYTLWERAARRASLPLAYSRGFHPQPKIHFAAPLPLGFASRCELMDIKVDEDVDLVSLPERLNVVLPEGVRVLAAEEIDGRAPALQTMTEAAEYSVALLGATTLAATAAKVEEVLAARTLPRERREKRYDLRPLIEELDALVSDEGAGVCLRMRLSAREGATGRPDEVMDALGFHREDGRIERTRLWLRQDAAGGEGPARAE